MPPALASEPLAAALLPGRWKAWRAVEGQHVVSTLRLAAGDPRRQDLLERILEESKPPLPEGAGGLHYLLSTPFRYPPAGAGSRFRGWGDPGAARIGINLRWMQASCGIDGMENPSAVTATSFRG